jgi:putative MATE family efflux protein
LNSSLTESTGSFRPMLRLALPVLAEELLRLMVGYTDWWLVSRYLPGAVPKAAMGLMAYLMWMLPCMFAAIAIGSTAVVAREVGAGNRSTASRVAWQSCLLGTGISLAAVVLLLWGGDSFVRLLGLQSEAAILASRYLWIATLVVPLIMFEQIGAACLRGAGDTYSGFLASAIVVIVNLAISAPLVTGWGPFPKLGWDGLAIGTAVGHAVGGVVLLFFVSRTFFFADSKAGGVWPTLSIDRELMRRVLRVGLPGGFDVAMNLTCHLCYVRIINELGNESAAAHGLGVQIEALAYLPGAAFQVAASTLAGQFLGARDPKRASACVLSAMWAAMLIMSTAALAFYFGGGYLTAFFTGNALDPTAVQTTSLLKIVAFSMPSLAMTMVFAGAFRGAGDTRFAMGVTIVGFVLIRIPFACYFAWETLPIYIGGEPLSGLGMGVAGAWYAMLADVLIRSVVLLARFLHGGWQQAKV